MRPGVPMGEIRRSGSRMGAVWAAASPLACALGGMRMATRPPCLCPMNKKRGHIGKAGMDRLKV